MTNFTALGSEWAPSRFVCVESITFSLFSGQEIPEKDGQGDDIIVKENAFYSLIRVTCIASQKQNVCGAHQGI